MLYTNGDSWTFGEEFPNVGPMTESIRFYNSWPWLLAQNLNIPMTINEGIGAGSNYRIFRRTCDFIFSWLGKHRDPKDLMIVLGWTTSERTEVFDKDRYCRITIHNILDSVNNEVYDYKKSYFNLLNRENSLIMQIRQMLTLRQICRNLGITYRDFIAIGDMPNYLDKICQKKFKLSLMEELYPVSWQHIVRKNSWQSYKFGHPHMSSHKKWADLLAEEYK